MRSERLFDFLLLAFGLGALAMLGFLAALLALADRLRDTQP